MKRIVFFDGDCGLCQQSVKLVIWLDRKEKIYYAPLNGETYKHYFTSKASLETIIYLNEHGIFERSNALLAILADTIGKGFFYYVLKSIPKKMRDYIYNKIVKHRKKVSCSIPSKSVKILK